MTEDRKTMEIKRSPTLFMHSRAVIQQLQKQLDGPLITYWHGTNGSVCQNERQHRSSRQMAVHPAARRQAGGRRLPHAWITRTEATTHFNGRIHKWPKRRTYENPWLTTVAAFTEH